MKNNSYVVSLLVIAGLLYTGSANAAQIASKDYVDRKDDGILQTVNDLSAVVDLKADASELAKKENVTNKTQTIDSSSTSEQYPSAAAVYGALETKANLDAVDGKLNANPDIEPGTGTKITYDSKGLVTGSEALTAEDIPQLSTDKITGLATVATTGSYNDLSDKPVIPEGAVVDSELTPDGTNAVQGKVIYQALQGKQDAGDYATTEELEQGLSGKQPVGNYATVEELNQKVTANAAITGGTGTKITYDSKGLVTGSSSLTSDDIPQLSTDKITGLATVATTGSYNDLSDKPVIPEGAVVDSELTPDGTNAVQGKVIYQALQGKQPVGDYATTEELEQGLAGKQDAGDYATTDALNTGLLTKQDVNKIVQAVRSASEATTENYPSEKAVADALATKADSSVLSNYATTAYVDEELDKKEDVANKRIVVRDIGTATNTDYPSELAVRTELDKKANKGTTLADYGITNAYTKIETDTKISEAITAGMEGDFGPALAAKEDKDNKAETITDLNKGSVDEYTSVKAVVDYVIPKPGVECQAESNLCVLSVDRDGNISWVNVTNPAN